MQWIQLHDPRKISKLIVRGPYISVVICPMPSKFTVTSSVKRIVIWGTASQIGGTPQGTPVPSGEVSPG